MAEDTPAPAPPPAAPAPAPGNTDAMVKALLGKTGTETSTAMDQYLKDLAAATSPDIQSSPVSPYHMQSQAVQPGALVHYSQPPARQPFSLPQVQAAPQVPVQNILSLYAHQLSPQTEAVRQHVAMLLSQPHGIVPGTRG